MVNYNYDRISYTNQNYNFNNFYDSMEEAMLKLCETKSLFACSRIISSFIAGNFYGVNREDEAETIQGLQAEINDALSTDKELLYLLELERQNVNIDLKYISKYYYYYEKLLNLLALFLESLTETLMPTTAHERRKVRYLNTNNFFSSYAKIKKIIGDNLATFKIESFKKPVNNIFIFYYCYRNYVRENVRKDIEEAFDMVKEFITDKKFLEVLQRTQKTTKEQLQINEVKVDFYRILLNMYSMMNKEHSIFNLNPKIQHKVYIDTTLI